MSRCMVCVLFAGVRSIITCMEVIAVKIIKEGERVRLQLALMDNRGKVEEMLFNFTIHESEFEELKAHMIEHLNAFELKK